MDFLQALTQIKYYFLSKMLILRVIDYVFKGINYLKLSAVTLNLDGDKKNKDKGSNLNHLVVFRNIFYFMLEFVLNKYS